MKGDVIYSVRKLLRSESGELTRMGLFYNTIGSARPSGFVKKNIFRQQVTDGLLTFRHLGIDVGDGTVIHFIGDGETTISSSNWIQHTSMNVFLKGGQREVDHSVVPTYNQEQIVERAISQVGSNFGGYDLVNNNCEHFANWCAKGKRTSRQIFHKNDDQDIVEKAIDNAFDPLLKAGDKIDKFFGWGKWK